MALNFADLSGLLAAALLLAAVTFPLLRVLRPGPSRWPSWYRGHFWLGAAAAVTGVVHCLGSITPSRLSEAATVGVWLASLAAALLVAEALLGRSLRQAKGRPGLLRGHLLVLAAICVLGVLHVLLDVRLGL